MSSPFTLFVQRLTLTGKTLAQSGFGAAAQYGLYQFGLLTGHYQRVTPPVDIHSSPTAATADALVIHDVLQIPSPTAVRQVLGDRFQAVLDEADEIVSGLVRLFGGPPVPLELEPPHDLLPLLHWTAYEKGKQHWLAGQDIKFIWEPARFGWVYPLVRAFVFSADERYPQAFWAYAERFFAANPPNLGPQWASGQEVALRLMALTLAAQVFRASAQSTPERLAWLGQILIAHARRIPPTLVYAKSQKNNHLITEAAGLITASAALPVAAESARWRELGLNCFNQAILSQISADGAYIQHSTNYHRLMLETTLWVAALLACQGRNLPEAVNHRLALAAAWLVARLDPVSGGVPNLGHNDGAHVLPLSSGGFADYRPVVQAAGLVFCQRAPLEPGAWDELSLWLANTAFIPPKANMADRDFIPPTILHSSHSWAELRAVTYRDRPAHADQLHVDLWWRGENLAQDAGTYLYNAPSPWENALGATRVHNTVEIDSLDQMTRAGRFRWVDWAQAQILPKPADPQPGGRQVTASHNGYAHLGAVHRRSLEILQEDTWKVSDEILPGGRGGSTKHAIRLHWLLPDWQWQWSENELQLSQSGRRFVLRITAASPQGPTPLPFEVSIARCGETIFGAANPDPILGWVSPTYGQKIPALSISFLIRHYLPVSFYSEWRLGPG
jgi:hypothetical protein